MMSMLALHENTHLTDGCVEILNDEWPRSKAARLHSITKSCPTLPYSLILVENESTVVGYCRLAKVISDDKSVLVESVVVDKKRRGQGLGRCVMEMAEQHAAKAGFHRMYLCTKDKQGFYQHLGYSFCKPVNTVGAMMLETCDCAVDTNTPLPVKDSGSNCCKSTDTEAISSSHISNSETIESGKKCCKSKETACSSASVCDGDKQKKVEAPPCEPPKGVAPPMPPPPPPIAVSSTKPALRIDWMVKDVVHIA
nr:N-alpha-acetyltransferase 80-like [Lytechinus pictus]